MGSILCKRARRPISDLQRASKACQRCCSGESEPTVRAKRRATHARVEPNLWLPCSEPVMRERNDNEARGRTSRINTVPDHNLSPVD